MALEKEQRGRRSSPRKRPNVAKRTPRKTKLLLTDQTQEDAKVKQRTKQLSLEENVIISDKEEGSQVEEAAAVLSGTPGRTRARSSGEGKTSRGGIVLPDPAALDPAVIESDDAESDASDDDSCIQFVIDAKPDSRLTIGVDDGDILLADSSSNDDERGSEENLMFQIDTVGSIVRNHDSSSNSKAVKKGSSSVAEEQDESERMRASTSSGIVTSDAKKSAVTNKAESAASFAAPCEIDAGLDFGDCYVDLDEDPTSSKKTLEGILLKSQKDKLISKSVLTPDFEKKHSIPPYKTALAQLKKQRKKERESTMGAGWFGMKSVEMTDELRNDIKVIRMRSTLDPKRFYKGNDMKGIPKFVQVGTVVDSPVDFYHSRVPKKERKQTVVDELLADADSRRYNKRKYMELQERFNSFTKGGKKRRPGKKFDSRKKR